MLNIRHSSIYLNEVRIHARHGVMPQETAVGADFIVNLRVGYDISRATATDDVADTLSYADMLAVIQQEMKTPSKLLEHVAGRIASALLKTFPDITSIDLNITKVNPPMGAECHGAGVEIHLINDKTQEDI